MSSRNNVRQLWHMSHGIVFAGGTSVVYPRLPPIRQSSSSTASEAVQADTFDAAPQSDRSMPSPSVLATKPHPMPTANPEGSGKTVSALRDNVEKDPDAWNDQAASSNVKADDAVAREVQDEDEGPIEPPYTPLNFQIPTEAFRKAKAAKFDSPESFWSYSLYRGPETFPASKGESSQPKAGEGSKSDAEASQVKVKVHYCKTAQTTERVLKQYFMHEPVLGFDLEWSPSATSAMGPRRNVSLVQLASPSRVALFHVALFPQKDELAPPLLKKLMEDPSVTKTGVWIRGDANRMFKYLGVQSQGLFELSHLYKLVKYSTSGEYQFINKKLVSLATQVNTYLGLPMFKGQDVRESDWTLPLQMEQIAYAASDAYAAVHLYAILNHLRQNIKPTPPLPYFAELNKPIRLADGVVISKADKPTEEPPLDNNGGEKVALPKDSLNSTDDTVKTEVDADSSKSIHLPTSDSTLDKPRVTGATKAKAKAKTESKALLKDARILEAEKWAKEHKASQLYVRAEPAQLRAYHIWYNNVDLTPVLIARLLRDPPLMTMTVVKYIQRAILFEQLPYEKTRLRCEILDSVPMKDWPSSFRSIAKACEDTSEAPATEARAESL